MKQFLILCAIVAGICLLINLFKSDSSSVPIPSDAGIEYPESSIF